jgi:glucosyl-dolichyl phosphate glucuronosyltransferase
MRVTAVSVLICTYNRSPRLAQTLHYFRTRPAPETFEAEVIVVDNNSTDGTRHVVEEASSRSAIPIRYAHECRQGKSFALNTGLTMARGEILALTDDDVEPGPDWLERIVEAFRTQDIVFAGGRVLPNWEAPPPSWLLTRRAQDIWGPLALLDYGDAPFFYTAEAPPQRRPVGANLAVRRDVMCRLGGWRTDLGKVNNTLISGEDHEIYFRMRRAGEYRGVYDPRIVVVHDVAASRLAPQYFRQWFFAAGRTRAIMLRDFYYWIDFSTVPHIAGVPRFLYREFITQTCRWLTRLRAEPLERFVEQLVAIRLAGLIWHRWTHLRDPLVGSSSSPA